MDAVKTSLAILVIVFSGAGAAVSTSIEGSCSTGEAMVSLEDVNGGDIAEPGHYGNQVCVQDGGSFSIRDECKKTEEEIFTIESKQGGKFSGASFFDHKVCADSVMGGTTSSDCPGAQNTAFSVAGRNDSLAGGPGNYGKKFCVHDARPVNITLELSGLAGNSFFADDTSIGVSVTRETAEFPYIVSEDSGFIRGIVGYEGFIQLQRNSDAVSLKQDKSRFLLPLTEGSHETLESHERQIIENTFLNLLDSSFSFDIRDNPVIRVILDTGYDLNGFYGKQENIIELTVENKGLDGDNLTVDIRPG